MQRKIIDLIELVKDKLEPSQLEELGKLAYSLEVVEIPEGSLARVYNVLLIAFLDAVEDYNLSVSGDTIKRFVMALCGFIKGGGALV